MSKKKIAKPASRRATKASNNSQPADGVVKKIRRYGAATIDNNNSGKGLDAYRRLGLGRGPRDGRGPGTYRSGRTKMPQEQKDGKGLTAYIPRKRKSKVAFPKGWK